MRWSSRLVSLRELSPGYYMLQLELLDSPAVEPEPLQFVMLWVPRVDEMPMTVADYERGRLTVIFRVRGEGTRALSRGPRFLGVRGFYGRGLRPASGERILFVAGGIGIAPLPYLARFAERAGARLRVVWGVRRGLELFDLREVSPYSSIERVDLATEDCSIGFCGTAVDLAAEVYESGGWDRVVAVGPNPMLAAVCRKLGPRVLVAPEAMTKCGIGACGSCVLKPTPRLLCVHGAFLECGDVESFLAGGGENARG